MMLDQETNTHYDAIIIGAGIGGLLTAAHLSRMGKKVVILERLKYVGGRFTSVSRDGFQLSTGAVHMIPYGPKGVFARLLRRVEPRCQIDGSGFMSSFHVDGKHVAWDRSWDVLKLFSPRERIELLAILFKMRWSRSLPDAEPFGEWLRRQTNSERIFRTFERIIHFSLSVELDISAQQVGLFLHNARRLGNPGILIGGCGKTVQRLIETIERRGGVILTRTTVTEILIKEGAVRGVKARDKRHSDEMWLKSDVVVSDVGPKQTCELMAESMPGISTCEQIESLEEARGLKIHFSSDESLIAHTGIMFCLDTRRVAGIVQPSNADPSLAPTGKHLLISHQVTRSGHAEEKALALADLELLFQDRVQVLSISAFKGRWPVNRARQGSDVTQLPVKGLHVVGDGCKASGYPMVEGVAKQVESVVEAIAARA